MNAQNFNHCKSPVVTGPVANDLCCGCGVCAAICPRENLFMQLDQRGQYQPHDKADCPPTCSACIRCCPFATTQINETELAKALFGSQQGIQWQDELGYFDQLWVGHAVVGDFRAAGASGGLASWMLYELLKVHEIDAVICIRPTNTVGRLYEYCTIREPAALLNSSGSAYYPVELAAVLREIKNTPGRYVITGLPCVCKGVRLAMKRDPRLAERIVYIFGLVCGHTVTAAFTTYLAAKSGLDPNTLTQWKSRIKDPQTPAHNFAFQGFDGHRHATLHWLPDVAEVWSSKILTPQACLQCDDIFAETADVVFMDAWLPAYAKEWRGTSLVLTRRVELGTLLAKGLHAKTLAIKPANPSDILASQKGVVMEKRRTLAQRLSLEIEQGRAVVVKRVTPESPSQRLRSLLTYQARLIRQSYAVVRAQGMTPHAIKKLDRLVKGYAWRQWWGLLIPRIRSKLSMLLGLCSGAK